MTYKTRIGDVVGITGTPNGSKFLRDDNSWAAPAGGGGGAPGYSQFVGATAANSSAVITHGLNTRAVTVVVKRTWLQSGALGDANPGDVVPMKVREVDENNIALEFGGTGCAASEYRVDITPMNIALDTTGASAGTLSSPAQTQTTVDLSLSGGTDAETALVGVNWYRVISGVDTFLQFTTGSTYTATGLTADTSYTFKAKRVNLLGIEGAAASLTQSTAANPNPPVYDQSSISAVVGVTSNTLNINWNHPAGAAARAIVAVPVSNGGSGGFVVTGTPTCTVGGTSLTYKGVQLMGNASNAGWVAVFEGAIPSSGSARAVAVSIASAGQTLSSAFGTCDTYTGVASVGALVSGQTLTASASLVVPSAANNLVWCLIANYQNGTYSSANFTTRRTQATNVPFFISGDKAGAAPNVTVSATESTTFHQAIVALDLAHA